MTRSLNTLVLALATSAAAAHQPTLLNPPGLTSGDTFGGSIAVSGNIAIVGAPGDDQAAPNAGAAYLIDLTTGQVLHKLLAPDADGNDHLGSSVAIGNDTVMVGAPFDNDNGSDSGSAYLFSVTTGQMIHKLLPTGGDSGDRFGQSVAVSGSKALVGAPFVDRGVGHSGAAYLFDLTTGQQLHRLSPPDNIGGGGFAVSVALAGDIALAGSPDHVWPNPDPLKAGGFGVVYRFDANTGDIVTRYIPNDEIDVRKFGERVTTDGNTIVIGAENDNAEAAYVIDATTDQQLCKLFARDGYWNDSFGNALAVRGDTIAVGASHFDDFDTPEWTGKVYFFNRNTGDPICDIISGNNVAHEYFGGAVALTDTGAVIGTPAYLDNGARTGAVTLTPICDPQPQPFPVEKLLPADGTGEDRFGQATDIADGIAIIGAPEDDDQGLNAGAAYLYDVATRQPIRKLTQDQPFANLGFSVAIDGPLAAAGAYADAIAFNNIPGAALIFDVSTGNILHKLRADDAAHADHFGASIDLSAATALIGAPRDDDLGEDSGSAYLFHAQTGSQIHKLTPDDGAPGDYFGQSVAVEGTVAVIGAPENDTEGDRAGAAYVFDTQTGLQRLRLTRQDPTDPDGLYQNDDRFGNAVAIRGSRIIVGAPGAFGNGKRTGAAYIFDADTGQQLLRLAPDPVPTYRGFGESVAIGERFAAVSLPEGWAGASLTNNAIVYLYDLTDGHLAATISPADATAHDRFSMQFQTSLYQFGTPLAIDGRSVLAGAWGDRDNGWESGSAYLFYFCPPDLNNDGFVDQGDIQTFITLFLTQDPAADLNQDTIVDQGDIQTFIAAFLAGC